MKTTDRSKTIGGSEIAAILAIDPYKSPYQLWLEKTGREPGFTGNKFTEAGIILEDAVARFFEKRTGYKVEMPDKEHYISKDFPFASGSPDRKYLTNNNITRILECKTNQMTVDDTQMPWFTQLQ